MRGMKIGFQKRGFSVVASPLIGWIIAIIILALMLFLIFVLKGKGMGALEFFKNIFSFGG
jgi:hypothetical protein